MSKNTGFSITSAERYSLALFELSEENNLLSQIEDQSSSMLNLIYQSNDFSNLIKDPTIKQEDLLKVINQIVENNKFDILFKNSLKGTELEEALDRICHEAKLMVSEGKNIIILSDRNISRVSAPIPALLAISTVHHFLIREGLRMKVSLILETGEARELHHFSVLFGYGIEAINPYLAFETIKSITSKNDWQKSEDNFIKASQKAIQKIMSKMGISTLKSYCGAQIFDAIGISEEVVNKYFTGTSTLIGGISLEQIQKPSIQLSLSILRDLSNLWR